MTALCGGGTSGPKVGVSAVVDYSSGLIAAILAFRNLGWLIPVVPLAGLPPLVLATFCGTDPPAVPTFTSAETNAILQLSFGADFDSGVAKLKDLILHSIWYDACQCTSGSPSAFPVITPPSGTPIFQPPLPPAVVPCQTVHVGPFGISSGSSVVQATLVTTGLFPTAYRFTQTKAIVSGGGCSTTMTVTINKLNPTFSTLATYTFVAPQSGFIQTVFPVPAGAEDIQSTANANLGGGTSTWDVTLDAFCNGDAPGGTQTPCCPPDTATQSYLDLILQTVTLIQRQSVPFAYVASTAHTTLSGAGVISISGLIGVKVAVTTIPPALGRSGTSPTEYFDMGELTFGTVDGYPQSYRLERESQILLPARCSAFTQLAYDLHPGVVVTVTELVREP